MVKRVEKIEKVREIERIEMMWGIEEAIKEIK